MDKFFDLLTDMLNKVMKQLLDRFEVQSRRVVRNFPFLMGEGVWIDSDTLGSEDEIGKIGVSPLPRPASVARSNCSITSRPSQLVSMP